MMNATLSGLGQLEAALVNGEWIGVQGELTDYDWWGEPGVGWFTGDEGDYVVARSGAISAWRFAPSVKGAMGG